MYIFIGPKYTLCNKYKSIVGLILIFLNHIKSDDHTIQSVLSSDLLDQQCKL